MHLALTDDNTALLLKELDHIIDGDRYFLSPASKPWRRSGRSGPSRCTSLYRRQGITSRHRKADTGDGNKLKYHPARLRRSAASPLRTCGLSSTPAETAFPIEPISAAAGLKTKHRNPLL